MPTTHAPATTSDRAAAAAAPERSRWELLRRSLHDDFYIGLHDVVLHRIGGASVVPRALRYLVYRGFGLDVRTPNIFPGVRFAMRNVVIGEGTFVNSRVSFEDVAPIVIGRDCQIGMEVMFVTSHHAIEGGAISKVPEPRAITVGDGCWFGARAMVLPGVTIGEGCVIAAGAVVTRDCAPRGVYAGIPARRVRDLDD